MNGARKQFPTKYKRLAIIFAGITALAVVAGVVVFSVVRQYRQTQKSAAESLSERVILVEPLRDSLSEAKVEALKFLLAEHFPEAKPEFLPLYAFNAGLGLDGADLSLFSLPQEGAELLGLNGRLADDTAYFTNPQAAEISLEINVLTSIDEDGFTSAKRETLTLRTKDGIAQSNPILASYPFSPSQLARPMCFVNAETYQKIAAVFLDGRNATDPRCAELVGIQQLYLLLPDVRTAREIGAFLSERDYLVYSGTGAVI